MSDAKARSIATPDPCPATRCKTIIGTSMPEQSVPTLTSHCFAEGCPVVAICGGRVDAGAVCCCSN
eukprot:4274604-Lingulodinium_polyedra.AAC.1